MVVIYLFTMTIVAWAGDDFLWSDQSKSIPETYATSPYHSHGAAVLSEGTANLIWVKCGAQSLPISWDLINPNRVIVFDDKEVSVQEPHCQIIVLLAHSAQSKVDKDQLPMWTVEGNKDLTLLLMEDGYWIPGQRNCPFTKETKWSALLYFRIIIFFEEEEN